VVNIFVSGDRLMGDIRFAPPEVYEFADTIFKLIDGGFINSVSVGFLPLEFEFADDRLGINFIGKVCSKSQWSRCRLTHMH
jgi:hypothetical protein